MYPPASPPIFYFFDDCGGGSVYEIITNIFAQSFMSASLTHVCPSNSLRSNYQTHRLHKIQITNFFPISFKNMFSKKELSVYIERKRI